MHIKVKINKFKVLNENFLKIWLLVTPHISRSIQYCPFVSDTSFNTLSLLSSCVVACIRIPFFMYLVGWGSWGWHQESPSVILQCVWGRVSQSKLASTNEDSIQSACSRDLQSQPPETWDSMWVTTATRHYVGFGPQVCALFTEPSA